MVTPCFAVAINIMFFRFNSTSWITRAIERLAVVRQGKGTVIERLGVPPLLLLVEERRRKKSEVEVRGIVGILASLARVRTRAVSSVSQQSKRRVDR